MIEPGTRERKPENMTQDNIIEWFDDFRGPNKYSFLSNFYVGEPIEFAGYTFPTGEHAFQALKAKDKEDFHKIRLASSPGESKFLGRTCELREDWEKVKYDAMRAVLSAKFFRTREEAELLLQTGDKLLVEGTYWADSVWGVDLLTDLHPGRNWLGHLLMAQRAVLRSEIPRESIDQAVREFAV